MRIITAALRSAIVTGAVVAVAIAGPAAAASAPTEQPGATESLAPAAQRFYWEWSDGVDAKKRTFRESDYGTQATLPHLLVFAEPARPQQFVKLQFKKDGAWRREDAGLTSMSGKATLDLNPYCQSGGWCSGVYRYRLLVNGQYTLFTITFRN